MCDNKVSNFVKVIELKNSPIKLLNFRSATEVTWVLALAFVSCGLFYEVLSALCSVGLFVLIVFKAKKQKDLKLFINPLSVSVGAIFLFYLLSVLWAADKGMAPFGVLKFLPLPLFMILLMQQKDEENSNFFFDLFPPLIAIVTVVTFVLGQIPPLKPYFLVNGRLAGCFGYPNTFAIVLLCAIIYTILKNKITKLDLVCNSILGFGIFYSGSRTVFILFVISVLLIVFKKVTSKKAKILFVLGIFGVIILFAIVSVAFGFTNSIGRFLTTSVFSSTFLGRFLYFYDALPLIFKNPFGLGYLGYYSLEQSIQSGLYSVRFIHNDFLQLLLDVGWIPTCLFVFAVAKRFFKKGTDFKTRLLIFVITAHSLFDFNLQFIFVFMLYIAILNENSGQQITLKKTAIALVPITALTAVSLYFGTAQSFYYLGDYNTATKIYSNFTEARQKQLTSATNIDEMCLLANQILELNPASSLSHSAKANYFFAKGDVVSALDQMNLAIEKAPFAYAEYEKTAYILQTAIKMYETAGDTTSAAYCKDKIISLNQQLSAVKNKISPLGSMIADQPTTEFSEEIKEYIKGLKNEN